MELVSSYLNYLSFLMVDSGVNNTRMKIVWLKYHVEDSPLFLWLIIYMKLNSFVAYEEKEEKKFYPLLNLLLAPKQYIIYWTGLCQD